jgi:ADP-heptose:LPS heptosyltransferase
VELAVSASARERWLLGSVAGAAGLDPGEVIAPGSLRRLARLVASARAVVVGDTGVAHLATAFGRPSVVLFGPVSPSRWGPPRSPRHVALWAGHEGDPHGTLVDPSLAALGVDRVVDALSTVMSRGG